MAKNHSLSFTVPQGICHSILSSKSNYCICIELGDNKCAPRFFTINVMHFHTSGI